MDLFVNTINNEADYGEIHSDLIAITERLLKCLEGKVDVEWVGFINSYILKTDISKLSDKVFNENILNINAGVTNSFSAKHANRFDVQNTLSNNQLSVSTGSAKKGEGEEMEGLIIVQDFNTKPTPKSISFEFVKSYVEEAKELIKINEIVKLLS
jgi:hypothetical protein